MKGGDRKVLESVVFMRPAFIVTQPKIKNDEMWINCGTPLWHDLACKCDDRLRVSPLPLRPLQLQVALESGPSIFDNTLTYRA